MQKYNKRKHPAQRKNKIKGKERKKRKRERERKRKKEKNQTITPLDWPGSEVIQLSWPETLPTVLLPWPHQRLCSCSIRPPGGKKNAAKFLHEFVSNVTLFWLQRNRYINAKTSRCDSDSLQVRNRTKCTPRQISSPLKMWRYEQNCSLLWCSIPYTNDPIKL